MRPKRQQIGSLRSNEFSDQMTQQPITQKEEEKLQYQTSQQPTPQQPAHQSHLQIQLDETLTNFNAFIDSRQVSQKQESRKNNMYTKYMQQKQIVKLNNSYDPGDQADNSFKIQEDSPQLADQQLEPIIKTQRTNKFQIKKPNQHIKQEKFVPYYMRNPDSRPKTQKKYDRQNQQLNLMGQTIKMQN